MKWQEIEIATRNTVVQVYVQTAVFNWLEPYSTPAQVENIGSAFFINAEGDMLTNWHVVDQAESLFIFIPALGQTIIEAYIKGVCPENDTALLMLTEESKTVIRKHLGTIPFLELGDSDLMVSTDQVIALGYPLGQRYLKSSIGIISGREYIDDLPVVQITAPINMGNSGGPLLNDMGKVIGINSMIIPAAQNIGYIIPSNEIKVILESLYKKPLLRKPFLGLLCNYSTEELATYLGNPVPAGVYITYVLPGSLADRVGIREGDMLYAINGAELNSFGDITVSWSSEKIPFIGLFTRFSLGETVTFTLYRASEKKELTLTIEDYPVYPLHQVYPEYETVDYEIIGGLVFMELRQNHLNALSPLVTSLCDYRSYKALTSKTVLIAHIIPGSVIDKINCFSVGDTLATLNEEPVSTLKELRTALEKSRHTKLLSIKSTEGYYSMLSLENIIKDELRLSRAYRYEMSEFIKSLL